MRLTALLLVGLGAPTWSQTGTVFGEQKLGAAAGGFEGTLASLDTFGRSLARIGDLDGDGVGDAVVGAPRELDPSSRPGKLWVLFLEADGSVRDEREITAGVGGFAGPLGTTDQFGSSVSALGDLAGMSGALEIAVGASGSASGGTGRGAVWILSLDATGAVVEERSIVASGLANGDQFGSAVAGLGDVDADGIPDVAVGGQGANDGGVDAGAIWVLLLNSNGTIKSQTKISDLVGGFSAAGGNLDAQDGFGAALASPGDLDADGEADLFVGTPGDDDTGANAGALWVVYLNTSGTVKATHKIAAVAGVDPGDLFGSSVTALGDLDLAGGIELAVGAPRDDDGASDRGAAWIVFLDTAEASIGTQKLSDTAGGFGGALNGGLFGAAVGALGDLDLDGRVELAVGESAAFAPSTGVGTGAMWVLSLVGPGDTVWTGAIDSDWFDSANWTNGLPGASVAAVIRDATNDPVIGADALDASCLDLALGNNASLSLPALAEPLTVQRSVRALGEVSGVADLRLIGDGSLLATVPLDTPVVVDSTGTVELRGSALALHEGVSLVTGELEVTGSCLATVVGSADFGAGILSGAGTLDLDSFASFSGTDVSLPPTLFFGGDLDVDAAFAPTTGLVVFDGAADQLVTQSGGAGVTTLFFDVDVQNGATAVVTLDGDVFVSHDLDVEGRLTASADLDVGQNLNVDGELNLADAIDVGANFTGSSTGIVTTAPGGGDCEMTVVDNIDFDGMISACQIRVTNPTGGFIVLTNPLGGTLVIEGGGTYLVQSPSLTLEGGLVILDGGLDVLGNELVLAGSAPAAIAGTLSVGPGGRLRMDTTPMSVESGGMLRLIGAPLAFARVCGRDDLVADGGYLIEIMEGAAIAARNFSFEEMDPTGILIDRLAAIATAPNDLRNGLFDRPASGGRLLSIERVAPRTFRYLRFQNSNAAPGAFNVHVPATSATISLVNWSGSFAGPAFEDDPGGKLTWGPSEETTLLVFRARRLVAQRVNLFWNTFDEVDCEAFVIERGPSASGPWSTIGEVAATVPGGHQFDDLSAEPETEYHYRLSERLTHGALRILGTASVSAGAPVKGGPAPGIHLSATPGGGGGPSQAVDLGVQAALALRLEGRGVATLEVEPGTYASFELDGRALWNRGLRLVAKEPGTVRIDASRAPLRVRGLDGRASLELAGLVVDTGGAAHPALVIEDCSGTVLLDRVEVAGGMRLESALSVLVQGSSLASLTIDHGSHADVSGGVLGGVVLAGGSGLESFGLELDPSVEPGSRWVEHEARRPQLVLLADARASSPATRIGIEAPAGALWWLLAARELEQFGAPALASGRGRPQCLGPARVLGATGLDQLDWPIAGGLSLYVRSLVFEPARGRLVLSEIRWIGP